MRSIVATLASLLLLGGLGGVFSGSPREEITPEFFLSSIFPVTITRQELTAKYHAGTLKVLIVPGHDNEFYGTEWKGMREADLNLKVAERLYGALSNDHHFQLFTTRDFGSGEYTAEFASYFRDKEKEIQAFREGAQRMMQILLGANLLERGNIPHHGFAADEVSLRLYGINKWANEHDIDITVHLHFNDYPRRRKNIPGDYSGFAIYVPERQYPNAEASIEVAKSIQGALGEFLPVSDFPQEAEGIVEDQDLIAVGSNASRKGVSVLIEYGYVYESKFTRPELRAVIFGELAALTAGGLKRHFASKEEKRTEHATTLIPYAWNRTLEKGERYSKDVLALQVALRREELYPPAPRGFSECPITGAFGPCTEEAVRRFQEKYKDEIFRSGSVARATGIVGPATREKLNALYGAFREGSAEVSQREE